MQAAHAALAVLGSLLSAVGATLAGLLVLIAATLSLLGELTGRWRPLRRLLPARASQNLIAPAPGEHRARLVISADLDARRSRGGWFPPAATWVAMLLLCLFAGLRLSGADGAPVRVAQFALSVVVLVGLASLLDTAIATGDGASGPAAAALALFEQLRGTHLRALDVELLLAGAGAGQNLGLERHLRRAPRADAVFLSLEHGPRTAWRARDGQLLALRMHPRLCALMARAASAESGLAAHERRSWQQSGAYAARRAGWAAIAVEGEPAAMVELCLAFASLLDGELASAS
ncbi:MAG: hypothetical protein NVSMB51_22610 [Solirubrobacteraceae bacterium]